MCVQTRLQEVVCDIHWPAAIRRAAAGLGARLHHRAASLHPCTPLHGCCCCCWRCSLATRRFSLSPSTSSSMRSTSAGEERNTRREGDRQGGRAAGRLQVGQGQVRAGGQLSGRPRQRQRHQGRGSPTPHAARHPMPPGRRPASQPAGRARTLLGHLLQPLAHHRLLVVIQLLGIRHLLQRQFISRRQRGGGGRGGVCV